MSIEPRRTCPSCGNEFSGAMQFCPVCMLPGLACLEEIPVASGWLKNIYQPDRENVARCSRVRLQSHCQEIV